MSPRPLRVLLAAAWLAGCGPSAPEDVAQYEILQDGEGEELVTSVPFGDGARWTFLLDDPTLPTSEAWFEGTLDYEGRLLNRYVTADQIVYMELGETGQFVWGSHDEGIFPTPFLELSLPLRIGKEWVTGDAETPDWYHYEVVDAETVEVPAGQFRCARVVQTNFKTGTVVSRWYANGVGLVQRVGANMDGRLTRTTLLRYAAPRSAP